MCFIRSYSSLLVFFVFGSCVCILCAYFVVLRNLEIKSRMFVFISK